MARDGASDLVDAQLSAVGILAVAVHPSEGTQIGADGSEEPDVVGSSLRESSGQVRPGVGVDEISI